MGREPIAAVEPVSAVPGFVIEPESSGLRHPTQVVFAPDGRLFVSQLSGEILAFEYGWDGVRGTRRIVASGVGSTLLGIGFDSHGQLFASSNTGANDTGFLARLLDIDGDGFYETENRFVTGLPNAGHHNDQLAFDGNLLYVGMGSRNDDGMDDEVTPIPAATLLRIDLNTVDFTHSDVLPEVYARGLRNPFGIALDAKGRIWVGDNGRDSPLLPDEFHLIVPGAHHGFPDELAPSNAVRPILFLGMGTSADGLDFYPGSGWWGPQFAGNAFLARFDYELNDPTREGMDVVRIVIVEVESAFPKAQYSVFARGFVHPLDVQSDPFGNLVIMEYGEFGGVASGALYRMTLQVEQGDADRDSDIDLGDYRQLAECLGSPATAPGLVSFSAACLQTFDFDVSDHIDLADFASFQVAIGPKP